MDGPVLELLETVGFIIVLEITSVILWASWHLFSKRRTPKSVRLERAQSRRRNRQIQRWIKNDRCKHPIPDIGLECPTCGYSLTGLLEERCPECGDGFCIEQFMR